MARYRNDASSPLNYSDSGGPWVEPGAEFEHDIPPAQLESHLRSGFISVVDSPLIRAFVDGVGKTAAVGIHSVDAARRDE